MDNFFIFLLIFIILLGIIMFSCGFRKSVISGVGGILASSFWLIHLYYYHKNLMSFKFEFLSAISWFIFSFFVIALSLYDD